MLLKEIKEDLKEWIDTLCLWIGILNIVNMPILQELICKFNAIQEFPCRHRHADSKIYMERQRNYYSQDSIAKE